ncbi:MAG: chemotaxis protein CheW [Verrucomicrobiota bacterium]
MLFLLFQVGPDRYALEASRVVEVVPLLQMNRIPGAPRGVAGFFQYRGQSVPAVDLCQLALQQPAPERLGTRIIVVRHPDSQGREQLLGLVAEQATRLLRKEAAELAAPAASAGISPHLGPLIQDPSGVIQWIRAEHLLSSGVRDLLFPVPAPAERGLQEPDSP